MSGRLSARLADALRLVYASARLVAGRRYWIATLLPLTWTGFQVFRLLVGWRVEDYTALDAQNVLIGFPLAVLAIGFGVRIIAGEIDRRTLEIAYTVPGGTHRVWLAKMGAAFALLVMAEILLALVTFFLLTADPWTALYGALQAAVLYLVLSLGLAALFKSEAAGALVIMVALGLNSFVQGANLRISPFWNAERLDGTDPREALAFAVQNRVGFAMAIAAITALAFGRAQRREKLLGG